MCVFVWHDPKLECRSPLQSPSSTAGEKRKDRTPEEGSKVIYLRALGAALGDRQRKTPHTDLIKVYCDMLYLEFSYYLDGNKH